MRKNNFTLWGLRKGEADTGEERMLFTDCETEFDLEGVVVLAREQGYHSLRVSVFAYEGNLNDVQQASFRDTSALGYSVKPQRKSKTDQLKAA